MNTLDEKLVISMLENLHNSFKSEFKQVQYCCDIATEHSGYYDPITADSPYSALIKFIGGKLIDINKLNPRKSYVMFNRGLVDPKDFNSREEMIIQYLLNNMVQI